LLKVDRDVKYSKDVLKWVKYEYFYSWIDKGYFLVNPIKDIF
jgi:hypothetical protein